MKVSILLGIFLLVVGGGSAGAWLNFNMHRTIAEQVYGRLQAIRLPNEMKRQLQESEPDCDDQHGEGVSVDALAGISPDAPAF